MEKLTILSFGGGQDSTALLYKYAFDQEFRARYAPGRFVVVVADTRDEHPETNSHVADVKEFCREHSIEFVHITPDLGFHSGKWQGLREFYAATNTCGSKAFPKTCTDNLKIRPIYRWLESWIEKNFGYKADKKKGIVSFAGEHGKITMLIGIAKGEESRMVTTAAAEKWRRESIATVYPLVDLGMDRAACQEYIAGLDRKVPPPSNCMLCPFMSEIELLWLHRNHPADLAAWIQIEANKLAANAHLGNKNLGVWGNKTLVVKLADATAKHGHMSTAELNEYKMSHGHCVKSKY